MDSVSKKKVRSHIQRLRAVDTTETEVISQITEIIAVVNSKGLVSERKLRLLISRLRSPGDTEAELISFIDHLLYPKPSNSSMGIKLIPLIVAGFDWESSDYTFKQTIHKIIRLLRRMGLASQGKPPVSKLMSLFTQLISLLNSMDLDSQPKPLSKLISCITNYVNRKGGFMSNSRELFPLVEATLCLEPEPELISLIHQIFSLAHSMDLEWWYCTSLSPQAQLILKEGKFHVDDEEAPWNGSNKWDCLSIRWEIIRFNGHLHFLCRYCNGQNHQDYKQAPVEIKHPLHQKHSLRLVMLKDEGNTRKCYCCDEEDLLKFFYYCSACDCAINLTCLEKPVITSRDELKWHEHPLSLFPSQASLPCNLCGLAHPRCPFYICPPCDFVTHQSCISLPRVIHISRHLHRISFTSSFDQGDWSCGICQRKIDTDYGGYSCIKGDCSYAAHSKCATQTNVWDGIELEGVPEEDIGDVDPFVRIGEGIIQHFSHKDHHLQLDENTERDYDDTKLCEACITPIYSGNFYSCMQCDFILHEDCANLSRKMYHPIHPHLLTLAKNYDGLNKDPVLCTACSRSSTSGFLYECSKRECHFKMHVQCGTTFEPLVHGSHIHPLFLTSKPEERRTCSVCGESRAFVSYSRHLLTNETFNCIETACEFALCFGCATLPQTLRYKHDKHMLTLSYAREASASSAYWCEICEAKIDPKERFYRCDENCCVTLHVKCLIGKDLYMKPGSSWFYYDLKVYVRSNNHHMSRPFCSGCKRRCPHQIVFSVAGSTFCSTFCIR